jgi:cell division protein FtsQ
MGRFALAQPRSVREALAIPWRQVGAVAIGVCAVLALLYLAARETSVFAVRSIEVTGAPRSVRSAAENAAAPFVGESLAALDGRALLEELEALPSVRSATYDRAFPSTLRIFIQPEQSVAVAEVGEDRWVVSERGRVIRGAGPASPLPTFRAPELSGVQPGRFLTDATSKTVLAALVSVPERFPARITGVRFDGGALTFALRTEWGVLELRLGESAEVDVKLDVAALVLRSLSVDERASAAYLDVSVPERTVVGSNSQVSS